jgi:translation initiation factor IF-1
LTKFLFLAKIKAINFYTMVSKQDVIELSGRIEELLPAGTFRVTLESGQSIIAHLSGKMRLNKIRLGIGDKIKVEMTPYDLTKGRIIFRY